MEGKKFQNSEEWLYPYGQDQIAIIPTFNPLLKYLSALDSQKEVVMLVKVIPEDHLYFT